MSEEIAILNKKFYEPIKHDWLAQSGLADGDFMREVSFALQHIQKNPYLQKCTQNSFLKAVINLAQVGLTLNPISKFAALVPRYNGQSKELECVLEPMYQGLQKLLTDSGAVRDIQCHVVYTGDAFKFDYSLPNPVDTHVPHFLLDPPQAKGTIKAVYSRATLKDRSIHVEMMSYADVCEIRDRSESYKAYVDKKIKTCIWVTDEPEMCRKTVIKRHYKYLPKSSELEKFERAVELDNRANGFDEPIDYNMMTYVESMIHTSTANGEQKETYRKQMLEMEYKSQAFKMIDILKDQQPILGLEKMPYTVAETQKAIEYQKDKEEFYERKK